MASAWNPSSPPRTGGGILDGHAAQSTVIRHDSIAVTHISADTRTPVKVGSAVATRPRAGRSRLSVPEMPRIQPLPTIPSM